MTEHSQRILDDLKARQQAGEYMACPRCGMDVVKTPVHTNALSRAADIYICDACGSTEAMLGLHEAAVAALRLGRPSVPNACPATSMRAPPAKRCQRDRGQADGGADAHLQGSAATTRTTPSGTASRHLKAAPPHRTVAAALSGELPRRRRYGGGPPQDRRDREHPDGGEHHRQIGRRRSQSIGQSARCFFLLPCRAHAAATCRRGAKPNREAAPDPKARHAATCGDIAQREKPPAGGDPRFANCGFALRPRQ